MDYITLMARKSMTKSDWMLEKWADANGYLDDPEPSVDVKAEEGDENPTRCPECHADLTDLFPEEVDWHLSGHSGYRDTHPSPDSLREDEGRWDKPSSVVRDISCPLCTEMQKSLYSTDTPQPDLEREYKMHLSKQHGLKPEEADIWEGDECSCGCEHGIKDDRELCTELECECGHDSNWTAKKPEAEEEVNMDSFDGLYNLRGLKGQGYEATCNICGQPFSMSAEETNKFQYPLIEIKTQISNHFSEAHPDKKNPIGAFFEEEEAGKDYAGTCPRCDSDNTKKTKSQAGGTIGLCNDCGETWKLKEAPQPDQKGGQIPLGKAGKPGEVSKVSKPLKQPLQPQTSPPTEPPKGEASSCPECNCPECGMPEGMCEHTKPTKQEPDPSNPDKELNPNPEIPPPVDTTAPDSDNRDASDKPADDSKIHMKPQTYSADGVELPDKIEIPERLFNDLMMMIEYSTTNDNEAGGFLIVAEHGNLGVVGEQFGKDREIVLEPNEQLHEGEQLIGTVHMHPVTPTASTGDVTGYLNDENEQVMVVVGADKSINFFFKIPGMTNEGDYGDEISNNFEQSDMGMMAEGFGFIWYRGEESDRTELHLMDNIIEDLEFDVLDESWPVEDVVKALGIKGRPDIPEEYSTKKVPLRLQIPFHLQCNEKRLKG